MSAYHDTHLTIKAWAEEDRPREKLLSQGRRALSDAELLAILLGSGSRTETAVGLARRVFQTFDLYDLGTCTLKDLQQFKGLGQVKAITVAAAMELGRRRHALPPRKRMTISDAEQVFRLLQPEMMDLPHEEFWIVQCNRAQELLGKSLISRGGVHGTVADAKIIFRKALESGATNIILAHNHPSGQLRPSEADIALTKKLVKAGAMIDIPVLDHVIISNRGYYSFKQKGQMPG